MDATHANPFITPAATAIALAIIAIPASAQDTGADHARPVPANKFGAPVATADGEPIEYDRVTIEKQEAAWLARGGAPESVPAGGCEGSGVTPEWKWFDMGEGIGERGLSVAYALGAPEIVLACGDGLFTDSRYWQIRRYDPASGSYPQRFTSPVYDDDIERLVAADIDRNGSAEVLVAVGGQLQVWDQASHTLVDEQPCLGGVSAMKIADAVPGGDLEVVLCTSAATQVRALDGTVLVSVEAGGLDLAVGQMDEDDSMEIALTSGAVIDVASGAIQWVSPDPFGAHIEAGDLDGDGIDEVAYAATWWTAGAYDIGDRVPMWSISIFNTDSTDLADVDGDGALEFVIGEAQWGDQLIYDVTTLALEATVYNPEHGSTETLCADVDGDGVKEVLWGGGYSSSGQDRFFVGEWATGGHEWASTDLDGPFRSPRIADLDGDGTDEILTVSNLSEAGYGAARILVFDAESFALEAISGEIAFEFGGSGTHDIEVVDLDNDGALEILIASSFTSDGVLEAYAYDGADLTLLWGFIEFSSNAPFLDVEVADLDGDGVLEIAASAWHRVYVYDAETQALEWTTPPSLQGSIPTVAIANVDDDPAQELLALSENGVVAVWDCETQATEGVLQLNANTLDLAEQPVGPHVLRVGNGGDLVSLRYDGTGFAEIARVTLSTEDVEAVTLRLSSAVFAGIDGTLRLFELSSGLELWHSCRDYGDAFGQGVAFSDDYLVTSGLFGLVAFSRR